MGAAKPNGYFHSKLLANLSQRPQDSEELSRGLGLTHKQVVHSMLGLVKKGLAVKHGVRSNLKWSLPPAGRQVPLALGPVLKAVQAHAEAAIASPAPVKGAVQAMTDMSGDFVICKGGSSLHLTAEEAKQVGAFFARFS